MRLPTIVDLDHGVREACLELGRQLGQVRIQNVHQVREQGKSKTHLANATPGSGSNADSARVPRMTSMIDGRRAGSLSGVFDDAVSHTLPGQAGGGGSGLELVHLLLGGGDVGEVHELGLLAGVVAAAGSVGGAHASVAQGRGEDLVGGGVGVVGCVRVLGVATGRAVLLPKMGEVDGKGTAGSDGARG